MRSDNELISAAANGEQEAFQSLVKRYEPRVAATVIGILGRCPEAEDVGQETFIRFYRSLRDFRAESGVGTYITRIAINLSLNELKRRKRWSIFSFFEDRDPDGADSIDHVPDPNASADFDDTSDLVHKALKSLEPRFRSVIVLRLIDGYSTNETADILGLPLGTVLSRLSRAQTKLKNVLKPHMGAYNETFHS